MNLNLEQKKLVTATPGGAMLVRGVAGSGKTTVVVHRVGYLLINYCLDGAESPMALILFGQSKLWDISSCRPRSHPGSGLICSASYPTSI